MELTLLRRESPLAEAAEQRRLLESPAPFPMFLEVLRAHECAPLRARSLDVLQVNVGKVCNQTCRHCHVDAGPDRRESMSQDVAEACLELLDRAGIPVLDITGGAPEMSPWFRRLAAEGRRLGRRVIDRCNLTILVAPGFEDLPEFLAEQRVEIVASLPCYLEENVDRQRGNRVFQRSIEALRRLNAIGYGRPGSELSLTLVFNPTGPSLPPNQVQLEHDYRRELRERYALEFTRLITITNLPISRFLDDLRESGRYETYMRKLVEAFNPATLEGLMCRSTMSVDWEGNLFDCDFNQMLQLEPQPGVPRRIEELDAAGLARWLARPVATGRHCFGCTAGAGSSCGGALSAT